jgi:hypothetical protein
MPELFSVQKLENDLVDADTGNIILKADQKITARLAKKYKKHKVLLSIIQVAVVGLVIAFLYMYISSFFANHFQRTLSGMAFPAFYFGTQTNIFNTWNQIL